MTIAPVRATFPATELAGPGAALLQALLEKGVPVSRGLSTSTPVDGITLVFDHFSGAPPADDDRTRYADLDRADPAGVPEWIEAACAAAGGPTPGVWKPWFPVVDYSRCTNCMQCLSFCLFDVYGVSSDGKLQVQNQSNCKTECPACSRVCPEVAIMFPKYRHGPINGEEITADDVRREAMKVDISALLGGDIYSMLKDRSAKAKSRFSKERDDDRALQERQNCLITLRKDLDVPPEVLAALPSPEEILAKAEAARLRALAATQPLDQEAQS